MSRKSWLDKLLRRPARPSYISPETFSKAFLAAVGLPQAIANNATPVNANNGQPLQANTKELIDTLHQLAPGNVDRFRTNLESWYNDAMDRVSGWYKRKTQGILLVLGLVVAAAFNADTLMLARAFWTDPVLRAGVVAAAQQYTKDHPNGVDSPSIVSNAQNAASSPASNDKKSTGDIADNYPSTTDEGSPAQPSAEPVTGR